MLFEQLIILALAVAVFFMIVLPTYRFVRTYLIKPKRDPLKEARIRLDIAKEETEAAKLNKEAERLYDELYHETLEDESKKEGKHE